MKIGLSHLNQKYDEEVEVGHSPKLLKHIFGDKVPKRVLEEDMKGRGLEWISHIGNAWQHTVFKPTLFPNTGCLSSKCIMFYYHKISRDDLGPCVWE